MKISIDEIVIPAGRRAVDQVKVEKLACSIKAQGLLHPIILGKGKVLVAGLHRIEAVKSLGDSEIEATVTELAGLEAELAEIDENLMRNELSYIEQGEAIIRREEILKELDLRQTVGRPENGAESAPLKTTAELAQEVGMPERRYQEVKQIAKKLIPELKELAKERDIPKAEAIKLSGKSKKEQKSVASEMKASYDIKDKDTLVSLVKKHGSIKAVARVVGMAAPSVRYWMQQHSIDYDGKTGGSGGSNIALTSDISYCREIKSPTITEGKVLPDPRVNGTRITVSTEREIWTLEVDEDFDSTKAIISKLFSNKEEGNE